MTRVRATTTAYRLAILAEGSREELASIISDTQLPVPDTGDTIDIAQVTGERANLESESASEEDISSTRYLVESREYQYLSFDGEGEGGGDALGCTVKLVVSNIG